jgi:hypothetical protein
VPAHRQETVGQDEVSVPLNFSLNLLTLPGVAAHFESNTDGEDANHVGENGHGDEAGGKPAASPKLKCGSLGIRLEHH